MSEQSSSSPTGQSLNQAEFWFDPVCPWAWMSSRWLLEVTTVRPIEVTWSVFSLSVLNEGRDLDPDYVSLLEKAWRPVRVIVAAQQQVGQQIALPLYTAIGTRLHPQGRRDLDDVLRESLEEVGLSGDLVEAGYSDSLDKVFRDSTARALDLVGDDVGTPVIAVNGVAFFGPVISPAPKGEMAGRLWDGAVAVASVPGFYELKRTRTEDPIFD